MSTPFVGFGNDTLAKCPSVKKGDLISCPTCKKKHKLMPGTSNGVETDVILFYKCKGHAYLGAIAGKAIVGIESDVHGEV